MPTIEVSYNDLCALIGKHVPLDKLMKEGILYSKSEVEALDGDTLKIEVKDTNRPDLWSTEGIARELAGRYHTPGLPRYKTGKSNVVVNVNPKLKHIRPLTVCAVIKDLKITPDVLSQMIQLQEKVSLTFGRNRKEVAIGVYDLHKITPPIRFTTVKPEGIKFIPLEFTKPMTPKQILEQHPKGKEYAHLLARFKEYPIFIDSAGQVLSMPPIINSEWTGKVTTATKDIFIECSGFDLRFLLPALNVIVTALADRGGQIETVQVNLPGKKLVTPNLAPKKATLDVNYARRLSGLKLSPARMCRLLEQARYKATRRGKKIEVLYPAYRQDIMHQADILEDVIISYGYNRIEPEPPKLATLGGEAEIESLSSAITDILIGLGLQETLSYILTNKQALFEKMNQSPEPLAEVDNPVSSTWCVFRPWLLPSLLEFLSRNKHNEYPQHIFEIGDAVRLDPRAETRARDVRKLALALCDNQVGYEQLASLLAALLRALGLKHKLVKKKHDSLIPGRAASIEIKGKPVGFIGELHPAVLENWGLERPVAALELDLSTILKALS